MSSNEGLLSQRSVWGVNPQVVETLIAEHEREIASYRSRIAELEARVHAVSAQRDEASRRTNTEQTSVQNHIAELESRLSTALAQAKASEEELSMLRESADRINVLREEAVQVVADAWAMAQAIEERAQQLVERTRNELMSDATKMRAQFEDERARHRAEMERLSKQRVQMLMQLEATARGLLDHATLIKGGEDSPSFTSRLDLALKTLNADGGASDMAQPTPFPPVPAPDAQSLVAQPITPEFPGDEGTQDAALLSSALDELEALLSLPKDRWQNRANGTSGNPATKPGDDLLHRLRKT